VGRVLDKVREQAQVKIRGSLPVKDVAWVSALVEVRV
jgi:hypothetical protein